MSQVDVHRGSSGARITCVGDHAFKWGDDSQVIERLHSQARWLQLHEMGVVPHVREVRPKGYVMDRLREVDRSMPYFDETWMQMINCLRLVWSGEPIAKPDWTAHGEKVGRLCKTYLGTGAAVILVALRLEVDWDAVPHCLTHGDPTFDNVMLNDSNHLVLIDPLPGTPAVPDVRAVDIGKILQSVVGWERARYGEPGLTADPDDVLNSVCHDDENERRAAWYWCAVHLLRAMPYVDEGTRYELRQLRPLCDIRSGRRVS